MSPVETQTRATLLAGILRNKHALVRRTRTLVKQELHKLAPTVLTPGQVRVLLVLADGEEHPVGNVSYWAVNHKAAKSLRGLGLVRFRYDDNQAYILGITLTDEGRRALECIRPGT